jgi:3-deoxy-D-manno-octulosonic-acid transferase
VLSPYYLRRMLRRGGYGNKIAYRLGRWPELGPKKSGAKRIWIQAVSVGEVSSISKLLNSLSEEKNIEIVLSGTTSTGLNFAESKFGHLLAAYGPFPLDWVLFSSQAWKKIDPDLVVMVDSELWPEHFQQARNRGIPIFIINARLSDRTFSRLIKLKGFHSLLFPENLTVVTASERQYARWQVLGLSDKEIYTSGNLKIDSVDRNRFTSSKRNQLIDEFGFQESSIVLAGISTWKGEEKLLIEIVQTLRLENLDIRLLLVPRHAERREEVMGTLRTCELPFQVRTRDKIAKEGNVVYLADTTGELASLVGVADFGFMGKTLPPNKGGQNPIEPIALGIPLVVGPNYQNFHETCTDMFLHGAAIKTQNRSEVVKQLLQLAKSENKRKELKLACAEWMEKQGSPSAFTLKVIKKKLEI